MNKISKFTIVMVMCLMAVVTLSGCSGKSVEDFTSEASGVWQKNGNLQDERLEVFEDATWTSQILEDGIWTTAAQGTIAYNEDYETFEFSDDMSNKIYPVEYSSDNGKLAWDGATGKLVAYAYQDGEIFAEFSINGNDELVTDDASYFFIIDEP